MTRDEKDFLLELSKSIEYQLELQKKLVCRLLQEDRYLTLQEVKEHVPNITAHKLNDLTRAGHLKVRKVSPRNTLYLESSLRKVFPNCFEDLAATEQGQ